MEKCRASILVCCVATIVLGISLIGIVNAEMPSSSGDTWQVRQDMISTRAGKGGSSSGKW